MSILQIGLGNFGQVHFRAWHALGLGDDLYIAELDQSKHNLASTYRFPAERLTTDPASFWDKVDVVDIVTGTESHSDLCQKALLSGKDVFIEKPMTLTVDEAVKIAELVNRTGRLLQVGYYYRYHPISQYLNELIRSDQLGAIRYLCGDFIGFKRPRKDVGVMQTDGIHFLDLFNWFLESFPVEVYAVTRDHFGRGLEDFALAILTYPDGPVAKVEAGYIQPGQSADKVVAGAMTTKCVSIVGSKMTVAADYEREEITIFNVHHELMNGSWTVVNGGSHTPKVGTASSLDMVCAELQQFINSTKLRQKSSADVRNCGVGLARVISAIYESASRRDRVTL